MMCLGDFACDVQAESQAPVVFRLVRLSRATLERVEDARERRRVNNWTTVAHLDSDVGIGAA